MKKLLSLICIVALLMSMMTSVLVMADSGEARFEVVSAAAYAGGTADVSNSTIISGMICQA